MPMLEALQQTKKDFVCGKPYIEVPVHDLQTEQLGALLMLYSLQPLARLWL
jgi:hypothetical protein